MAADHAQASTGVAPGVESMSSSQVGHIPEQIIDGVAGIFQGGRNGEAFSLVEKAEEDAAAGRMALVIDEL